MLSGHMQRLSIAAAVVLTLAAPLAQTPERHTQLVIVVDGLRPDAVSAAVMPRLFRLGRRGVVFNAHHSVIPTVTRVNASSFVTGTYPETHGLLGNTIYIPSVDATRGLDTGERDNLERVARAEGKLLTAPTLGEILQGAGKKLLGVSSGSTGSAFLLNHTASGGGVIHTDYSLPQALAADVARILGPVPAHATPNDGQNQRAVDAYLKVGLDQISPDVTLMWLNDPDGTAHENGVGAPLTLTSLRLVDHAIGRIEDTLADKGLLARTNIIVTSDHGFSKHTGGFNLESFVEPFVKKMPDGSKDIVVAEGAIYLRGPRDSARVDAIVAALQKRPEVGAIFTRPVRAGSSEGVAPGTLSFDVVHWNHARSGDILVSPNWSDAPGADGFAGTTTQGGVAGHGSTSPFDVHNTLIAAGPDFRERATSDVPTANADIAPTLLRLLGLPAAPSMTGRVIEEGLRNGRPAPAVTRSVETAKTSDGGYVLTAQISTVAGRRYVDSTSVTRK
jgi:arylsulfatase A-like enzyme